MYDNTLLFFSLGVLIIDDDRKVEDLNDMMVAFLAWQVLIHDIV